MSKRALANRFGKIGFYSSMLLTVFAVWILVTFLLANSRTFQFFGGLVSRVETSEKVVALTFDDGPSEATEEILAILGQRQVKGTFYVTGRNVELYPAQTWAMITAGHELGNHSYSHQRMVLKSLNLIDQEIQRTNTLLWDAGYRGPISFRPPYGKKLFNLPWYLKKQGIPTIMWDVEPDTYAETDPDDQRRAAMLVEYTLANVKPGSIVLLHPFWGYGSADRLALGAIIDGLQELGYRLVTVSELLAMQSSP